MWNLMSYTYIIMSISEWKINTILVLSYLFFSFTNNYKKAKKNLNFLFSLCNLYLYKAHTISNSTFYKKTDNIYTINKNTFMSTDDVTVMLATPDKYMSVLLLNIAQIHILYPQNRKLMFFQEFFFLNCIWTYSIVVKINFQH